MNNVAAAVDAASRPSAVVFLGAQVFDGGESGPRESPESIPMSNPAFNDGIRTTNMYVRVWGYIQGGGGGRTGALIQG